jgi:hypothetical protein
VGLVVPRTVERTFAAVCTSVIKREKNSNREKTFAKVCTSFINIHKNNYKRERTFDKACTYVVKKEKKHNIREIILPYHKYKMHCIHCTNKK